MTKPERQVELIVAGVGGKGVLVAGEMLAVAGMKHYRHTLYAPTYASAMRGGTCQAFVIMSDNIIHRMTIFQADILAVMEPNQVALFKNRVKSGGFAITEAGSPDLGRTDVNAWAIPATRMAAELGDGRVANMIFIGAIIGKTGIMSAASVESELISKYAGKTKILDANVAALNKGLEWARGLPAGEHH